MEKTLKKAAIGISAFLAAVYVFSISNSLYWFFPWMDIPLHFLGGLWAAVFFAWLNLKFNLRFFEGRNFLWNFVLTLSFAALIGVLWEFFEFSRDFFSSSMDISKMAQISVSDTMGDLFFDLLGGAFFVLAFKRFFSGQNL
jgi:hypothetical protein